jgi:hypothetical protein
MDSRGIPVMLFGSNQLTASQVQAIRSFVEAGGKLFVMTSAHSAAMYDDWTVMPTEDKLLPVLSSWGLEVGPELVLDISCFRATFLSEEENPVYQQVNYPLWIQACPSTRWNILCLVEPLIWSFIGVHLLPLRVWKLRLWYTRVPLRGFPLQILVRNLFL